MAGTSWYYAVDNQQRGPVSQEQLLSLISAGQVRRDDLVWCEGMHNWIPAGQVPVLAAPVAAAGLHATAMPESYPVQPAMPPMQPYPAAARLPLSVLPYAAAPQYAGFWARFAASLIDSLILGCGAGGTLGLFLGMTMGPDAEEVSGLICIVFGTAIAWLYEALLISSPRQATVGKMALGIRVTDLNGQRITFANATGRFFAKYISMLTLFIGYIMAAFTERRQALHDMMASTLVIRST